LRRSVIDATGRASAEPSVICYEALACLAVSWCRSIICLFVFTDTATTEIYTLSLHDALPIYGERGRDGGGRTRTSGDADALQARDRKSTRLNSSHGSISYAVFCLKKKKTEDRTSDEQN